MNEIISHNGDREYENQIDFSREYPNWGLRGEIFFHLETDKLPELIRQLCSLKILETWEITIRSNMSAGLVHYVNLSPMTLVKEDLDSSLQSILNYLESSKISITYKEGEFGYKITSHGDILEKWGLDDGGC
jgi:hypothetical protein